MNNYYNNDTNTIVDGNIARAVDIESKLNDVVAGFDGVDADISTGLTLSANDLASRDISALATPRAEKVIGFDSNGELVLVSRKGVYKGDWVASTFYAQDDTMKDVTGGLGKGLNSIFVSRTSHTSSALIATDTALWDVYISNADLEQAVIDSQASATQASNSASSASSSSTAASSSEAQAGLSETNSATSETNSEDSNLESESWANENEDVPVKVFVSGVGSDRNPVVYSSKHYSVKSAASMNNKVEKTGDSMTGPLSINSGSIKTLIIDKANDTAFCGLSFDVNNQSNFLLYTSNDGSGDMVFQTRDYNNAGLYKDTVYTVSWSSSVVNFLKAPTSSSAPTLDADLTRRDFVVNTVNSLITNKNVLVNTNFSASSVINQRNFGGGQPAAGIYGYDRWKGDATGTALVQIVEDGNYKYNTTYTLSGTNITTSQIVSPASGDWTVTIPTNADLIQLEEGSFATAYEFQSVQNTLAACHRYYFKTATSLAIYMFPPTAATGSVRRVANGAFPVTMRAAPTLTVSYDANYLGHTLTSIEPNGFSLVGTTINAADENFYTQVIADAEL